ncbi:unnamed protein product [Cunninghamella blakesleeana]
MSNSLSAASVGVTLSIVFSFIFKLLSEKTAITVLAVQLGAIGGVYLGFSLAITEKERLLKNDNRKVWEMFDVQPTIETLFIAFMIFISTKAVLEQSKSIICLGYVFHGLWDLLHHYVLDKTLVPRWYIPFCTVFDVFFAILIYLTF